MQLLRTVNTNVYTSYGQESH